MAFSDAAHSDLEYAVLKACGTHKSAVATAVTEQTIAAITDSICTVRKLQRKTKVFPPAAEDECSVADNANRVAFIMIRDDP